MNLTDKSLQQHALINFMGAILQSPSAMVALREQTLADGTPMPIEEAVRAMASNLAALALRDTATTDLFQIPDGSGAGDALKMFLSVQENPARIEFEDTLQEGELCDDAVALILNDDQLWIGGTPDGQAIDFPGSGDEDGEGRINDLIRATALLLAEIARLERKVAAGEAYAADASERGTAAMPEGLH